jgi:hypothetical protein
VRNSPYPLSYVQLRAALGKMKLDGEDECCTMKTELDGSIGEDGVAGEDIAQWGRWSSMAAPRRRSHRGGGPRRGSGARDEGSTEEGIREGGGAKTSVGSSIADHGKEQAAPHLRPLMLLEAAHRSHPTFVGPTADRSSIFTFARERCWR